jgi:hypothetical protein
MKKVVVGLTMLAITFILIQTVNNQLFAANVPNADVSEPFITYNDTTYDISVKYPSDWQIDESAHQYLISLLQNLSSSESQTENDRQNNAIKSKVLEILDAFGLQSISDVFGLSPDKRLEFLQIMSRALNEGSQVIVTFTSRPEDEFDKIIENMNIVVNNNSAATSISLNDYVNANIEGMKTGLQDFTIVQPPTKITIDGRPAMTLVYTARLPIYASTTVKNLAVFEINANTRYVLTFTSTPETYSAYAPTFERMLHSFKTNN